MREWLALAESGSGERGIFNRDGVNRSLPQRRHPSKFGVNPCGEINLRSMGLCNLSIAVARADDTIQTLAGKVKVAAIFGTLQASLTDFQYLRPEWKANAQEEALLGVDITGHADCPLLRPGAPGRSQLLDSLKQVVARTNEEYAARIGINRSAADTCVKPSGDSSVFFWCASGLHPWFAQYFIRRVRERTNSPVAKFLKDSGVPWVPAAEDTSLICFEFPCQPASTEAPTRLSMSATEQLENWLVWKQNWAEHSVSCTVYVEAHEWLTVGQWVHQRFDDITGLSFLPRDNGTYTSVPYEEITEIEYKKRLAAFPVLNWSKLQRYEQSDTTESAQTYACTGGACDV